MPFEDLIKSTKTRTIIYERLQAAIGWPAFAAADYTYRCLYLAVE